MNYQKFVVPLQQKHETQKNMETTITRTPRVANKRSAGTMLGVTPEEAYRIICDDVRAIYREP